MNETAGSDRAMRIERTFDASIDVIWQMWTDPEHFANWYGPPGATVHITEMDVRVGGGRLLSMELRTPDGPMSMWFTGTYREVIGNTLLVYTDAICDENGDPIDRPNPVAQPGPPATTEVRVQFEDLDGRTKLTITHIGIAADSPGAAGWAMALDTLGTNIQTRR